MAISPSLHEVSVGDNASDLQSNVLVPTDVMPRTLSHHPEKNTIGDLNTGVQIRH